LLIIRTVKMAPKRKKRGRKKKKNAPAPPVRALPHLPGRRKERGKKKLQKFPPFRSLASRKNPCSVCPGPRKVKGKRKHNPPSGAIGARVFSGGKKEKLQTPTPRGLWWGGTKRGGEKTRAVPTESQIGKKPWQKPVPGPRVSRLVGNRTEEGGQGKREKGEPNFGFQWFRFFSQILNGGGKNCNRPLAPRIGFIMLGKKKGGGGGKGSRRFFYTARPPEQRKKPTTAPTPQRIKRLSNVREIFRGGGRVAGSPSPIPFSLDCGPSGKRRKKDIVPPQDVPRHPHGRRGPRPPRRRALDSGGGGARAPNPRRPGRHPSWVFCFWSIKGKGRGEKEKKGSLKPVPHMKTRPVLWFFP